MRTRYHEKMRDHFHMARTRRSFTRVSHQRKWNSASSHEYSAHLTRAYHRYYVRGMLWHAPCQCTIYLYSTYCTVPPYFSHRHIHVDQVPTHRMPASTSTHSSRHLGPPYTPERLQEEHIVALYRPFHYLVLREIHVQRRTNRVALFELRANRIAVYAT